MRILSLVGTAVASLGVGLGIAYVARPGPDEDRGTGSPTAFPSGSNPVLSALPSDTERIASFDRINADRLWIDVPEPIFRRRMESGRWNALASPRGLQSVLGRALGISAEDMLKVSAALVRASEQFRNTDIELHQVATTDAGVVVTLPAYPERGREIFKSLRAEIEAVSNAEAADVVIAIAEISFARTTGSLGTRVRTIKRARRDNGEMAYSTGGQMSNGLPLDWQHLAPAFDPTPE